jgi:putative aminopeptidase FrvX
MDKKQASEYIVSEISKVIDEFPKRDAGSKGERIAQEYIAEEMKGFCDEVKSEDFDLKPRAFLGWVPVVSISLLLGGLSYFVLPFVSIVLVCFALVMTYSQLITYKGWFDFLYKKETSVNVHGVIKPKGEVKRRMIIGGHTDAPYEWPWLYRFGFLGFLIVPLVSIVGMVYLVGISIFNMIDKGAFNVDVVQGGAALWLGVGMIPFVICWIMLYRFSNPNVITDGANDNLTAVFSGMAVGKKFSAEKLQNTELIILQTGAEEAGLRGAKAFAKKYAEQFKDVPTGFLALETLREENHLALYSKDLNGTVKADEDMKNLVKAAGAELGIELPDLVVTLGSTDAAAAQQAGIKSICLGGMNHTLQKYYHTRLDSKDNLCPKTLEKAYEIICVAVKNFDESGF